MACILCGVFFGKFCGVDSVIDSFLNLDATVLPNFTEVTPECALKLLEITSNRELHIAALL